MAEVHVRVSAREAQQFEGDAVVVGVFADERELSGPAAALDSALAGVIAQMRAGGEITGVADEVTLLHTLGAIEPARVAIIGLGARARLTTDRVRRAAAIGCRALRKAGARDVGLALAWDGSGLDLAQAACAETEGALLGLYAFTRYKSSTGDEALALLNGQPPAKNQTGDAEASATTPKKAVERVAMLGDAARLQAAVERGTILADAVNYARDLANEPPNVLTPQALAERAQRMAATVGLESEVHGPDWMREHGMGALLGVAQGSAQEPRFIALRHRGGPADDPGFALVGKGITFDTGGISIKPAADMDEMKMDMAGGAAVIGAMQAIARLKLPVNVTGLVPATENMPDGAAYRPGDILRAANGKTIEILNTDAEGRLALADALSYAVEHRLSPIVDIATLTGAMVIALGHLRAGYFSNDEAFQRTLQQAADTAGERIWPMPFDDEYGELIQSEIADMKQKGPRDGGAISAAKMLQQFVNETPWAHIDMAGKELYAARRPDADAGATGFGVRMFVELAAQLASQRGATGQA